MVLRYIYRKGDYMFHEEIIIDGCLCWRSVPAGDWTKYTDKQLTDMIHDLRSELFCIKCHADETDY
jgi:hypothetical protein